MSRIPVISLTLGFVLLIGMVVGVALFSLEAEENTSSQDRLFRASVRIGLFFSAVQDVEVGQRGYLLTRDEAYLEPYEAAVRMIPERIRAVEEIIVGRPDQVADFETIKKLTEQKVVELRNTIELAREGKESEALAIVRSDVGLRVMDQIRELIARMRERQATAITAVTAAAARSGALLRYGFGAVAVLVFLLAGLAFIEKRRQRIAIERHAATIEGHSRALETTNRQLNAEMKSREAAESQVRQMQKIEAVGQLTGGVAHDFNNMLAVVVSALGLAQRRMKASDFNVGKYIDAALDACHRAATLTRRLLAFSRQQTLEPQVLDPNKLVADMSELLRRTLGEAVRLETVLAGGLWRIRVDPSQLENSIINLAVNARDAMPDGGKITLETANCHLDETYVRENSGAEIGQYVLIAVSDTGSGMPPEVVARAFDPFFTTKKVGQGTGLGLSQVHGFVKQSGGHIKIYSEVGQGTTVKLYLPRHMAGDVAAPKPESRAPIPRGSEREVILVVEDEDSVRVLSVDSLEASGYTVLSAPNGKQALEILRARPDIALLFTDIVMPDMSGRKVADAAHEFRPDLKVLYTTGFTRNAVVHNGILDPGVRFIAKPFTLEQLAAKVREALDG